MFLSIVLSGLALLGSAACFVTSGLGLTDGPFCRHNQTGELQWDYPFASRAQNYLYEQSLWTSVCIEPPNIVTWNVSFFSALLLFSAAEMLLVSLQILNSCFGCLCGLCEGK